jgi:hypothetical protein
LKGETHVPGKNPSISSKSLINIITYMDYILPLAGNKLITLFYEKKRKKKKRKHA